MKYINILLLLTVYTCHESGHNQNIFRTKTIVKNALIRFAKSRVFIKGKMITKLQALSLRKFMQRNVIWKIIVD